MTATADPAQLGISTVTPARYDVQISHRRRDPIEYGFSQRSSTWLVDLDRVPALPRGLRWLASFRSVDHPVHQGRDGSEPRSLRQNLDAFLAEHGIERPATILMLANPRVLGYVFNPLSVFYCLDSDGHLGRVLAEVRNTYGGQHCYLLEPDLSGKAATDKAFYVSPFYPVDGEYIMRLPVPGETVRVDVTLHRAGERPFSAVLIGHRRRASSLWSAALRSPLATRAVMFGIKRHGISLYLKGLRPPAQSVEPTAATSSTLPAISTALGAPTRASRS
ncbi:MAG: hypothetical protein JWN47_251 [Frankiales bacterium]|nr:hypothetical protein [Frankiales bacterium]